MTDGGESRHDEGAVSDQADVRSVLFSAVSLPPDRVARFLTLSVENLEPIHSSGKHSTWWAFS
jgi:hypothetical protein